MKHLISFFLLVCLVTVIAPQARAQGGIAGGVSFVILDTTEIDTTVGTKICFTLVVKDSAGNVITDWNTIGTPILITLNGSTANTDTSTYSWNDDSLGFSYAELTADSVRLPRISPYDWSLSETLFVDGMVTICFIHTKAEQDVYLTITPNFPGTVQTSVKMNFRPDEITNYLLDITPQTAAGNQVYQYRRYEVVVFPRDKYLNVSHMQIKTRFTTNRLGEFPFNTPGLSNIFVGDIPMQGVTNYFLASTIERELPDDTLLVITAYAVDDSSITGRTTPYEVLSHEPYPFALFYPSHDTTVVLDSAFHTVRFSWGQPSPADPYTNVSISRFSGETASDAVTYEWVITDSASVTLAQRLPSTNAGKDPFLVLPKIQIKGIMSAITGSIQWTTASAYWYVEASDGLYITKSSPPTNDPQGRPGHLITFVRDIVGIESVSSYAEAFTLNQNYPNPFNPSTTIEFSVPQRTHATLKVYDVVGNEIETLVNEEVSPGTYKTEFNAAALPSGVYIYKLTAGDRTLTKRMVVAK